MTSCNRKHFKAKWPSIKDKLCVDGKEHSIPRFWREDLYVKGCLVRKLQAAKSEIRYLYRPEVPPVAVSQVIYIIWFWSRKVKIRRRLLAIRREHSHRIKRIPRLFVLVIVMHSWCRGAGKTSVRKSIMTPSKIRKTLSNVKDRGTMGDLSIRISNMQMLAYSPASGHESWKFNHKEPSVNEIDRAKMPFKRRSKQKIIGQRCMTSKYQLKT